MTTPLNCVHACVWLIFEGGYYFFHRAPGVASIGINTVLCYKNSKRHCTKPLRLENVVSNHWGIYHITASLSAQHSPYTHSYTTILHGSHQFFLVMVWSATVPGGGLRREGPPRWNILVDILFCTTTMDIFGVYVSPNIARHWCNCSAS